MKLKFSKRHIVGYSAGLGFLSQFIFAWIGVHFSRSVNDLSASEFPLTKIFDPSLRNAYIAGFIQTTLFIILFWLFVRWVASTAEKSGRSYVAFMFLAIFLPLVAWIVVITFKNSDSSQ